MRHRLSLLGNRKLNYALHMVATSQDRSDAPGGAYYRKKLAEGKSPKEALRCLKRRVSDAVFRSLLADTQAPSRSASLTKRSLERRLDEVQIRHHDRSSGHAQLYSSSTVLGQSTTESQPRWLGYFGTHISVLDPPPPGEPGIRTTWPCHQECSLPRYPLTSIPEGCEQAREKDRGPIVRPRLDPDDPSFYWFLPGSFLPSVATKLTQSPWVSKPNPSYPPLHCSLVSPSGVG